MNKPKPKAITWINASNFMLSVMNLLQCIKLNASSKMSKTKPTYFKSSSEAKVKKN